MHPVSRFIARSAATVFLAGGAAHAQAADPPGLPLPSARAIVDRHVEAIGGREALRKHSSRYIWASLDIVGQRTRGTVHVYSARPNKRVLRVDQSDAGSAVTGFDGEIGWRKESGKSPMAIRGRELLQLRDDAVFDLDLKTDDDIRLIETVGLVQWERRQRYKIRVVSVTGREWVEFFDVETGLFAGSEARRVTDKGEVTLKTVVSGYKLFGGIRLPSQLSLRSAGVEQVIRIIGVRHDGVSAATFEAPATLPRGGGG